MERLVEPEVLAGSLDLLAAGVVAREEGGRIARRQAEQHEPDDRHHQDDGDRAGQAPGEIAPHFLPSNHTPK